MQSAQLLFQAAKTFLDMYHISTESSWRRLFVSDTIDFPIKSNMAEMKLLCCCTNTNIGSSCSITVSGNRNQPFANGTIIQNLTTVCFQKVKLVLVIYRKAVITCLMLQMFLKQPTVRCFVSTNVNPYVSTSTILLSHHHNKQSA